MVFIFSVACLLVAAAAAAEPSTWGFRGQSIARNEYWNAEALKHKPNAIDCVYNTDKSSSSSISINRISNVYNGHTEKHMKHFTIEIHDTRNSMCILFSFFSSLLCSINNGRAHIQATNRASQYKFKDWQQFLLNIQIDDQAFQIFSTRN